MPIVPVLFSPVRPSARRGAVIAACAALLAGAACLPSHAESSIASSASDSVSTSVGSLSDSIKGSSNSSTGNNKVAQGDYRITDVAALPEQPGMQRLALEPVGHGGDGAQPFMLYLPQAAVAQHALAAGQVIQALDRPYGMEFDAGAHRPFFLALADDWMRELPANAVRL